MPPRLEEVVPMAKRRTLELCERAREELRAYRDRDGRPQVRERCAAVLKVADGLSPYAVARRGLLRPRHPDTVYGWVSLYEREGVAGLLARLHGGARRGRL